MPAPKPQLPPGTFGLIVAGGSGTRLWPESRAGQPKQLLDLTGGGESLLQQTFGRLARTVAPERVITVTNREYAAQTLHQLQQMEPGIAPGQILAEPKGRSSAPAILWGALRVAQQRPEAVMVIVWADHLIGPDTAFDQAIARAAETALGGHLVAIGIKATRPETGFGYIEAGDSVADGVFEVRRFVEKPDRAAAEQFVADGGYCWNAGLFAARADLLLEEFDRWAPELMASFRRHAPGVAAEDWGSDEVASPIFDEIEGGSFDRMVLEKSQRLRVIPAELDWCDLGSWDTIHQISPKDDRGNAVSGNAVVIESRNCLIRAGHRLVTAIGVENLIVIDTGDAVLVCDTGKAQHVKALVGELRRLGHPEADHGATTIRPWGSFTTLSEGPGYKLKMIEVAPHQKLSLQMHRQRAEHWIVMEGTARVVKGDSESILNADEHIHIEKGEKHRLSNDESSPLVIIELQQGEYLGEDDIVRFEDTYGRT